MASSSKSKGALQTLLSGGRDAESRRDPSPQQSDKLGSTSGVKDPVRMNKSHVVDTANPSLLGLPNMGSPQPQKSRLSLIGLGGAMTVSGLSQRDPNAQKLLDELRRKREEERVKELNKFRDAKEAMRAKKKAEELEVTRLLIEKEKRRRKRDEAIKQEIAEWRQVITGKQRDQQAQYQQFLAEQMAKRTEEVKDAMKKRKQELVDKFKQDHVQFVKRQKSMENKSKLKAVERSPEIKARQEKFDKDWVDLKLVRETQFKVVDMCQSAPMQEIFKNFEYCLQAAYDYMAPISMDPFLRGISGQGAGGALPYRNFFVFVNMFGLLGTVVDTKELKVMYRSTTNGRKVGNVIPVGLHFEEFKQILFRIAVRHQPFFDKTSQELDTKGASYLKAGIQFVDIWAEEFHSYRDVEKEKDLYPNLDKFTFLDLEKCLRYFCFPSTVPEIHQLLDSLRKQYHKSKPERLKELPKKELFMKIHKTNAIIQEQRAKIYGPSQTVLPRERTKSAKLAITEHTRSIGIRNKSAISKTKASLEAIKQGLVDPRMVPGPVPATIKENPAENVSNKKLEPLGSSQSEKKLASAAPSGKQAGTEKNTDKTGKKSSGK